MKYKFLAVVFMCFVASACYADMRDVERKKELEEYGKLNKCEKIQFLYERGKIENILRQTRYLDDQFNLDINGDGKSKQFKYFLDPKGIVKVLEVYKGGIYQLPQPNVMPDDYMGLYIIQLRQDILFLHLSKKGPYEVHKLEQIDEESISLLRREEEIIRPVYDIEIVCKYHSEGDHD